MDQSHNPSAAFVTTAYTDANNTSAVDVPVGEVAEVVDAEVAEVAEIVDAEVAEVAKIVDAEVAEVAKIVDVEVAEVAKIVDAGLLDDGDDADNSSRTSSGKNFTGPTYLKYNKSSSSLLVSPSSSLVVSTSSEQVESVGKSASARRRNSLEIKPHKQGEDWSKPRTFKKKNRKFKPSTSSKSLSTDYDEADCVGTSVRNDLPFSGNFFL